jgi:integrase
MTVAENGTFAPASTKKAIMFTRRVLDALPPPQDGRKDYTKFDTKVRGLGVRVTRRSKILGFKKSGSPWIPLGRHPGLSLELARKEAHDLAGRLNHGEDPGAERRARRARKGAIARGEVETLKDAVEGFIAANPRRANRLHLEKTRRIVSKHFAALYGLPIDGLKFEEIRDCVRAIAGDGARKVADERIGVVYRWAAAEYGIVNPIAGKKLSASPLPRQVYLTGPQMREIFHAAGALGSPIAGLIQFMMLVPIRRSEAAGLRRDELDDKELVSMSIPASRMKGGVRAHRYWAPLAPQVAELIRRIPQHGNSNFVFTITGAAPLADFSGYKKKLDLALARAGVSLPKWTWHDFRRSFVVWASDRQEEFDFDVAAMADRCLGHEPLGRIQKTYNPSRFAKEMRLLLAAWADYLNGEAGSEALREAVAAAESANEPDRGSADPKRGELRWGDFPANLQAARLAYGSLSVIATHPEAVSAVQNILRRDKSVYTQEFRKKGPPMGADGKEAGRIAAQHLLHAAAMMALRRIAEWRLSGKCPSKFECAKALQKDFKAILAKIYIPGSDTLATSFANAAYDTALSRWMIRERKPSGWYAQQQEEPPALMPTGT